MPRNETYLAGIMILAFPASKTVRNKCLLFKPPSLWYFVMAAALTNRTWEGKIEGK